MSIVYHIICYIVCFVAAMAYVWYGENHTRVNPPKDENDFEQRMVVAGVALTLFVFLHGLLTIKTW